MTHTRRWQTSLIIGLAAVGITTVAGLGIEFGRFGLTDAAALARVEADVRSRIDEMVGSLRTQANRVSAEVELIGAAGSERDALRALFGVVDVATVTDAASDLAITVYGVSSVAVAWAGRPTELPVERLSGPESVFIAPGPSGLQLVYVRPVFMVPDAEGSGDDAVRIASIAAERPLSSHPTGESPGDVDYVIDTSLVPATLRARFEGAGDRPEEGRFLISAPDGQALLEVQVSSADLNAARQRWRGGLLSLILALLALTVLAAVPLLIASRARARSPRPYVRISLALGCVVVGATALAWLSDPAGWWPQGLDRVTYTSARVRPIIRSSFDLLLLAAMGASLVAFGLNGLERLRLARREDRWSPAQGLARFLASQLAAGGALALLLVGATAVIAFAIDSSTIHLLHLSLHPWDPARLALMTGLVTLYAMTLGAGVGLCLAASGRWRIPRRRLAWQLAVVGSWSIPLVVTVGFSHLLGWNLATTGLLLSGGACVAVAATSQRLATSYRHASQAPRLLVGFLVLLVPALLLYPTLLHLAEGSKQRLVETQFAPQAARHSANVQASLYRTLAQIDVVPGLTDLVSSLSQSVAGPSPTEAAFLIWRGTDLARFRLTSAIELYADDGTLVNRFSMNFPQVEPTDLPPQTTSCAWNVMAEASPFGSEERRLFHAERTVCTESGEGVGTLMIHVLLDYGTLPFISSKSPYFELFQTDARSFDESAPGRDVELVTYGWGRRPSYASGAGTWPLGNALFERLAASREPFWARVTRDGIDYHVYFSNDRAGIYALGYPVTGPFEQLVHLAEIATLAAIPYLLLLTLNSFLGVVVGHDTRSGRGLLREIRANFSRRLFLAFVAASVVPLLILAVVMRGYFANRLRVDVEAEAGQTAAVAQRVIEEALVLQQSDSDSSAVVTDDALVWIGKVIGQDVNIFEGPRLIATSERDLFASGLLPTRTPHQVFRAIVLERQTRFVGEDTIGDVRYMLAAAPVRFGAREAILTVPLALRQQEIEAEIDELDRRVYLAAMLFSLLGAAIGLSMAERIADPVRRLTSATRRIARGNFDAAVATRSADELQRLVAAFNHMASDLKNQRHQLERTHRLEAWAEMARQVAHEIKNPLTPIQLSAEHLRRVHADEGAPLGAVLDSCIDSILTQVRLLRQIAAEFSSFASSPTPRPRSISMASLIREVVDPYRPGVEPRIVIRVDVPASMPHAHIDRTLVARAITNLVENALHSMASGGILTVAGRQAGDRVAISVTDTGTGMDAEAVERAFEPYFSTKTSGTGLGLTIAKRNVELLGGSVDVASQPGDGTTVTLYLPVAATDA